jgi:hypothetical protein
MDSLDQLYANGSRPELPVLEGERGRARDRKAGRERTAEAASPTAAAADGDTKTSDDAKPAAAASASAPLSPAARAIVVRRRIIGAVAALAVVILAVLIATGTLFDSGNGNKKPAAAATPAANPAAQRQATQVVGQLQLKPVAPLADKTTQGFAAIAVTGKKPQLAVRAKLPPSGNRAYEVWLYNSPKDAYSVGAQRTDAQGNYEGAAEIPADWAKYKYIDISLENVDQNRAHSGRSILRGALKDMQAPPTQQPGASGGTGTTPGGTGTAPGGTGTTP